MTRRNPSSFSAAGFSLLELLVTLVVMAVAVIGALTFFDMSTRLARSQVQVAGIQSAQRVTHHEIVRVAAMAGVGGLPEGIAPATALAAGIGTAGVFPDGLALAMVNNVAADTDLGGGGPALLTVGDTDVLTLRGVFSTPVYHIEPQLPLVLDPGTGTISIAVQTIVDLGVTQDLDPLRRALDKTPLQPEAVIVYDRYNPEAFAVLQYVGGVLGSPGDPTVNLVLSLGSGATHADPYGRMTLGTTLLRGASGAAWTLPGGQVIQLPEVVGAIGVLEEYRFFIRQEHELPGVPASRLTPVLTRARYYPGTDLIHPEGALDLADNVIDFQVALAVDQPVPGTGTPDGQILEIGLAADDDEVLFNFPGDNDGLGNVGTSPWADPASRLNFLRVSTVVQGDRTDPTFPGAVVDFLEDHDYAASASIFNERGYTKVRKRLQQSTVQVRNLP